MNIHPLNKLKIAGTVVTMVVVALVVIIKTPDMSHASGTGNVHGFLWSDMPDDADHVLHPTNGFGGRGFGWISLNSDGLQAPAPGTPSNPSAATPNNYGVSIDTNGVFSGYGWSENGGWLDFAPAGPFPPYNDATPAKVMPSCWANPDPAIWCNVIGWARFTAGTDAQSGGWDGWVSLNSDSAPVYHVAYQRSTGKFQGYAWGGTNAGWIKFDGAYADVVQPNTCIDTTTGQTISYPANSPMPAGCVPPPINDICPNNSVPDKNPALQGTQTGTGPWLGSNGTWYGPDINGDGSCDKTNDLCPITPPGNQSPNQTMTWNVGGVWYGMSNNICIPSVCSNYSGFYATPPANEIIIQGQCVKLIDYCKLNPTQCSGGGANGPLKPIYKEN